MATKLLTKRELEYLNDVHQNIHPYFTYTIRNLDYKLEKCKTEKERNEITAKIKEEKAKRAKYIRSKYFKDVDLNAFFAEKKKRENAERKQLEKEKEVLRGIHKINLTHYLGVTKVSIDDTKINITKNTCSLKCSEFKYFAKYYRYGHRYPEVERKIILDVPKGYHIEIVGGIVTIIKGEINRIGMPCYWVESFGKCQVDKHIVKGFLVRGEHIKAKSLKEAQRINAEHRTQILSDLLKARAKTKFLSENEDKIFVTFEDSLKSGNCEAGTQAFCNRLFDELGHEVSAISVKDLRKYGKKFNVEYYTQRIINRLLSRKSLKVS